MRTLSRSISVLILTATVSAAASACSSSGGSPQGQPTSSAGGQGGFSILSTHVGDVRTYAEDDAGVRRVKIVSLTGVTRVGDATRVAVRETRTGLASRVLYYVLQPDGQFVFQPTTQTDAKGVTVRTGAIAIPSLSELDSGRPVRRVVAIRANKGEQSITVQDSLVLQGHGRTQVKVPAGSYDALAVTLDQSYRFAGKAFSVDDTYYVAAGIGTVERIEREKVDGTPTKTVVDKLTAVHDGNGTHV